MDVLVTGGAGAIGRFVVAELANRGHDVTVFDRIEPRFDGVTAGSPECSYLDADVTDSSAVAAAIDTPAGGADAIVHLAALLPDACEADPRRAEPGYEPRDGPDRAVEDYLRRLETAR